MSKNPNFLVRFLNICLKSGCLKSQTFGLSEYRTSPILRHYCEALKTEGSKSSNYAKIWTQGSSVLWMKARSFLKLFQIIKRTRLVHISGYLKCPQSEMKALIQNLNYSGIPLWFKFQRCAVCWFVLWIKFWCIECLKPELVWISYHSVASRFQTVWTSDTFFCLKSELLKI